MTLDEHDNDHHRGLAADVSTLLERRRVLKLLAAATVAPAPVGWLSRSAGASGLSGTDTVTDATCISVVPEETAGPYPGDGSNGPNVLSQSGIVRQDIRPSFGSSTTVAQGTVTTISLTILNAADSCNPLVGAAVYLWHCNRDGAYSLYSSGITNENYLRGVQVTDSNGTVTFTSVFPACYSGRWPHIHYEVYPTLASATSSSSKIATSQIAIPKAACDVAYTATGYSQSITNLAQVSLANDNVFSDGYALQLASTSGDNTTGWTISNTVAITASGITSPTTSTTITPTSAPASTYAASAFTPLATPYRFLDTRNGIATSGKAAAGSTVVVPVAGVGGVPAGASAVVFNLTATDTGGWGYVTAWPDGSMPTASNLNVDAAGQTRANLVTIPIGSDGSIRISPSMAAHLVGDLVGSYSPATSAAAGRFVPLTPSRLLDSRNAVGRTGKLGAGEQFSLTVAGRGGVPTSGVAAVVLALTATESAAWGFVTAWPSGSRPETSSLNVDGASQTVANQVVIPLSAGSIQLYASAAVHLLADVVGYYTDASATSSASGLFVPVTPYRVVDTRSGARRSAGSTTTVLAGAAGTAAAGRAGAVMNVTMTDTASTSGFVTVWPDGTRPTTSSANCFAIGQTVAGHVTSGFGSDGGVRIYNDQATHLVADVTGWFTA